MADRILEVKKSVNGYRVRCFALSVFAVFAIVATILFATGGSAQQQPGSSVRPPANAVGQPGAKSDNPYNFDEQMWAKIRKNAADGTVSIPDKKSATLVQSQGEVWRNFRNGPLPTYGAYAMAGMLVLLGLFFLVRGRIKIEHGWAGRTIERFSSVERMGHWLLATSFIILALTGLNVLYGRSVLLPIMGKDAFAAMSQMAKWAHNYVAFAFMLGLVMTFVMWVLHNFPNRHDIVWLVRGGGMIGKGHPPAKKFNAGQKILFWLIMLGGLSISLSGLALMFPFQVPLFAKTFQLVNSLGLALPTTLTPMEEMQYATSWHSIVALFLVVVIFAHIYIGTLGMQGAFSAMGSGQVDVNWAKEHHNLWADQMLSSQPASPGGGARPQPAE